MSATKLLTILLSITLVIGGATAVLAVGATGPGDLPQQADERAENATDRADNATEGAPETETPKHATDDPQSLADSANESVGPPGGLPNVVPDFVSDLHERIDAFRTGSIDHLGSAIRSGLPFL